MDYQIFLGMGLRSRVLRVEPALFNVQTQGKKSNVLKYAPTKQKLVSRKHTHKKRRIAESFHNVAFFKLLLSDTEQCHDLYTINIIHCCPTYLTKKPKTAETAAGRATG